jgi:DNA-binding NtrC family response regulator
MESRQMSRVFRSTEPTLYSNTLAHNKPLKQLINVSAAPAVVRHLRLNHEGSGSLRAVCCEPRSDPHLGRAGTGKSALAQHIHSLSGRTGPFVEESAPAIPRDMEAAHLTGHARGAFTGAHEDRKGLLEAAHLGTFFLDEIGLASAQLQQVLLRLTERRPQRRLGELRERPVDVRLIAATNEDLAANVKAGSFRADLLDRFGHMIVRMPNLADREDEILPLANHFLAEAATERQLLEPPILSQAVQDFFMASKWPGHVRELRAVCRASLVMALPECRIEMQHLPPEFVAPLGDIGRTRYSRAISEPVLSLQQALEKAGGNKSKAARLLGISRQQLYRLLHAASG